MRGRLRARIAIAVAILAVGVGAAHFDDAVARVTSAAMSHDGGSPRRSHDEATTPSRQARDVVLAQTSGVRTGSLRTLGARLALLAAALLVLALKRRGAFADTTAHSSLWHGTIPLGRGPPPGIAF